MRFRAKKFWLAAITKWWVRKSLKFSFLFHFQNVNFCVWNDAVEDVGCFCRTETYSEKEIETHFSCWLLDSLPSLPSEICLSGISSHLFLSVSTLSSKSTKIRFVAASGTLVVILFLMLLLLHLPFDTTQKHVQLLVHVPFLFYICNTAIVASTITKRYVSGCHAVTEEVVEVYTWEQHIGQEENRCLIWLVVYWSRSSSSLSVEELEEEEE